MCCGSWGRKESDMTERLNWTDLIRIFMNYIFQHTFKHKSQNLSFPDVSVVKNLPDNAESVQFSSVHSLSHVLLFATP